MYRPPKFAPTSMGGEKISKQERNARRKEEEDMRQAHQSAYVRELMDDLEGRPEEVCLDLPLTLLLILNE